MKEHLMPDPLQALGGKPPAPRVTPILRRRIAIELAMLGICTPLFLRYAPRDAVLYMGLAALFVGYVFLTRQHTAQKIWGPPTTASTLWLRQSIWQLGLFTAVNAALLGVWGLANGHKVVLANVLAAVCLYFPWALLQQGIFQFYLHGRLRVIVPYGQPWLPALLAGLAYGAVHFPHYELMLLTSLCGTVWGLAYQRNRLLWPVALSHAVLGSAYYYCVIGADLVANVTARLMSGVR
ncbi:MAG: type II CAAX prenyl endopeptidase Rce1 family protein [Burkholderiaceae bacterium]